MFGASASFFSRHFFHISGLAFVIGLWLFSNLSSYPGTSEVLSAKDSKEVYNAAGVFSPSPRVSVVPSPGVSASLTGNNKQTSSPSPSPADTATDETENLVEEVNSFRMHNGKSALGEPSIICDFAKKRLSELYSNYSHAGFDANWRELNMHAAAENIAMTSSDRGNHFVVFEMWAKSEGHRLNMLGDYTQGCGYYDGHYAVFNFAR